ncbi:hypothetical protein Leryth_004143 [Lithospermum erythrorhizon]|nr:hypothetical protein Leryth_004143 [Lithospermum erythrorhizon]
MGACCSCQRGVPPGHYGSYTVENDEKGEVEENEIILEGDLGARVRLQGSSMFVSMYSQQGNKGTNQDAMTVWENFTGDKDTMFVGVFDGHGPCGHKVAQYARDHLPSRISTPGKRSSVTGSDNGGDESSKNNVNEDTNGSEESDNPFYSSWKSRILRAFKETDEGLEGNASIESYCSGATSVAAFKKGEHLIIMNLGDSRAILCSSNNNKLVAEQLTVDLKPSIPTEAERIASCQGRVMAMQEEPSVFRIWMPDEDCPGLAMSRAFGDFCLKDYGLISTPQLFYRKLTPKDEFIVLATDGVWDVLPNDEVVAVVATSRTRSAAAKRVVHRAVRAWRIKYPLAKVDDCAVVCLFFNNRRALLTRSPSERTHLSLNNSDLAAEKYVTSTKNDDGLDTVLNCNVKEETSSSSSAKGRVRSRTKAGRKYEFVES